MTFSGFGLTGGSLNPAIPPMANFGNRILLRSSKNVWP